MDTVRRAAPNDCRFDAYADYYQNSEYARFSQEHRKGGSLGVGLMNATQEAHDLIEPALPDLLMVMTRRPIKDVSVSRDLKLRSGRMDTGTMFVYPAHTEMRTLVGEDHEISVISVPWNTTKQLFCEAKIDIDALEPLYSERIINPRALQLFDAMWATSDQLGSPHGAGGNQLYFDGLTLQFLAGLLSDAPSALSPFAAAPPEDKRIARVVDYIEAHFGENLDLGELAGIACLSPAHFSRVFKSTTGQPVWAYVQQRRCARAKEMLTATRLPIIEVAHRCGFSSQQHFTRVLSRAYGATPGQIRSSSRGNA